jgi:hypothetical protein
MIWDNLLIYFVLASGAYIAWRKYKSPIFWWLFWVGTLLGGASGWQYVVQNKLNAPEAVQMGSLIAVQILRLVLLGMLLLVIINLFRSRPLSDRSKNIAMISALLPVGLFISYLLVRLFI